MPALPADITFSYEFACIECGACCRWSGQVVLTEGDIDRLARGLGLSEDALIQQYTRLSANRRRLRLLDQGDGVSCIFLEGDRCRMYAHRPEQCRRFPFPDSSHTECPGLRIACRARDP